VIASNRCAGGASPPLRVESQAATSAPATPRTIRRLRRITARVVGFVPTLTPMTSTAPFTAARVPCHVPLHGWLGIAEGRLKALRERLAGFACEDE
jgi:hypothetical protein